MLVAPARQLAEIDAWQRAETRGAVAAGLHNGHPRRRVQFGDDRAHLFAIGGTLRNGGRQIAGVLHLKAHLEQVFAETLARRLAHDEQRRNQRLPDAATSEIWRLRFLAVLSGTLEM